MTPSPMPPSPAPAAAAKRARLVVFTDLDGTLLNHDDYSYADARPALSALSERDVPLVIVSSKTRPEIEALRAELHNRAPFAPENGAAVIWPGAGTCFCGPSTEGAVVTAFGPSYASLRDTLSRVRTALASTLGTPLLGFGDVDADTVAAWTGLSPQAAALAQQRMGTEPIHVPVDEKVRARLRQALSAAGVNTTAGGRFVHAIGPFDKGTAVRDMLARFRDAWPEARVVSAALGDSQNDRPMLEAVDLPVVVPRAHGAPLSLAHAARYTARAPGARGFADGVQHILAQFEQESCLG